MFALSSDIPRPFTDMAVLATRLDATMVVFDPQDRIRYVSPRKRELYSFCDFSQPKPMTFDQMFRRAWEYGVSMGQHGTVGAEDELQDAKRRRLRDRLEFTRHVPTKLLCSHARVPDGWSAQIRVEPGRAGLEHFFADDNPAMSLVEVIRQQEEAAIRAAALECLEVGVAVVGVDGKIRYRNAAMTAIIKAGKGFAIDDFGRLRFAAKDLAPLDRLIAAAATGQAASPQVVMPTTSYMLSVSRGPDRLGETAIIVVAPIAMRLDAVAEIMRRDFGLTPAEAELAALVGSGQETSAAAATLGNTAGTGRTTMKAVYKKLTKRGIPVSGQPGLTRWTSILAAITGAARKRGE